MKILEVAINSRPDVSLTAYLQDVEKEFRNITKRPAVLVIPGGGYQFCSDREADPVAFAYLKAGYNAFILRYSVGADHKWPEPLEDYEDAMKYIEIHAEEWNVLSDKIAVVGFSAGGHLAGAAATIAKHKPVAAILGYAVLNEVVDEIAEDAPIIAEQVDYNTVPCFLFASRADNVVPIKNTLDMAISLDKAGITFESHIYAFGPHGFSVGDTAIQTRESAFCERIPNWVQDSVGFLKDVMGDFCVGTVEEKILSKPKCKAHVTDDESAWLSLDCTIGRIMGNPAAKEVLTDVIEEMKKTIIPFTPEMTFDDMMNCFSRMKLRDILHEKSIEINEEQIDALLREVPNI